MFVNIRVLLFSSLLSHPFSLSLIVSFSFHHSHLLARRRAIRTPLSQANILITRSPYNRTNMTGRRKATESTTSKPKLPEVPLHVFDDRNKRQYLKGGFLGKVRVFISTSRSVDSLAPFLFSCNPLINESFIYHISTGWLCKMF